MVSFKEYFWGSRGAGLFYYTASPGTDDGQRFVFIVLAGGFWWSLGMIPLMLMIVL
jgi:hypothetical protein